MAHDSFQCGFQTMYGAGRQKSIAIAIVIVSHHIVSHNNKNVRQMLCCDEHRNTNSNSNSKNINTSTMISDRNNLFGFFFFYYHYYIVNILQAGFFSHFRISHQCVPHTHNVCDTHTSTPFRYQMHRTIRLEACEHRNKAVVLI